MSLYVIVSPRKVVADSEVEFSLLREEGQMDVFLSRRWCLELSSSEEESDEDESEDPDEDDEDINQVYLT